MKSTLAFAIGALTALAFAGSAGAATPGFYSGNFPLTVTHSAHSNFKYCLTLTDDGSEGFPHSGQASLFLESFDESFLGEFQLIDHTLVATIEEPGNQGSNAGAVFVAPARSGIIGNGAYDQVLGGAVFDAGVLVVGKKGGCSPPH